MNAVAIVKLRPDAVEWRLVDDEVVALDLTRSTYLGINPSGAAIWPLLADGATFEAMGARLVERFGIGPEQAAADVDAFVADLRARGLVSEGG